MFWGSLPPASRSWCLWTLSSLTGTGTTGAAGFGRFRRCRWCFSSSASDNMNIVMALNMGGDDFIAKPVDPMVLTAKVQAVLRRTYEIAGAGQTVEFCGATLSLGDGCLHTEKGRVELTKNEFRILQLLLENRGKIVSREELMMRLWQSDLYVEENTLTVNVARLRKKLEEGGLEGVILTKPGRGYIIL